MEIFNLKFEHDGKSYSALISEKKNRHLHQYRITVMNGELEKMLYGNNILNCKDGKLVRPGDEKMEPAVARLHSVIANELTRYLQAQRVSGKLLQTNMEPPALTA